MNNYFFNLDIADNIVVFKAVSRYVELGHYLTTWTRSSITSYSNNDMLETIQTIVVLMSAGKLDRCLQTYSLSFQECYDWKEIECSRQHASIDYVLFFEQTSSIHLSCDVNMLYVLNCFTIIIV